LDSPAHGLRIGTEGLDELEDRLDRLHVADAGHVGRRRVGILHEARAHRIGDGGEQDRLVGDRLGERLGRRSGHAQDQVEVVTGELLGDARRGGHVTLGVLQVVRDVGVARRGKRVLEAVDGRVEGRMRDDLADTDRVGLAGVGAWARTARGVARAAAAPGDHAGDNEHEDERQREDQFEGAGHCSPFECQNEC
jgi:hypothetical protein